MIDLMDSMECQPADVYSIAAGLSSAIIVQKSATLSMPSPSLIQTWPVRSDFVVNRLGFHVFKDRPVQTQSPANVDL